MAADTLRATALVACLLAGLGGCHSVPGVSEGRAGRSSTHQADRFSDPDEGWLFKRLFQKDSTSESPQQAQAPNPTGQGIDGATLSAAPTPPPGPGETVVTAATLAAASKPEPKKAPDEEDSGFDLSALAPENVVKKVKVLAGYGPNEQIARAAYDKGHQLFREKKYEEAAAQFKIAADRWPDTSLEEDALFWRAESLFFADRYPAAHDAYEKLLKKYEYSRHLDRAVARQFAIGRYWEQFDAAEPHWPTTPNLFDKTRPLFDTRGHALKAYEHVRLNDPTGPLADDALMASANSYFVHGQYEDAAYHYDLLRKEYPKSEHQKHAHLLCLESKQRMYQGPMYDGTPLKEASEIADQTLMRFGPTLQAERDRVIEAKNRIVEQQAERDWAMAQYYEKNRYYGAARYYYNALIQTYPHTRFAQLAQQRLDAIEHLPAEPPDRFQWLTRLLGPAKKR